MNKTSLQLSVGAGWAGMVWADLHNALASINNLKLKSEIAQQSGSYMKYA